METKERKNRLCLYAQRFRAKRTGRDIPPLLPIEGFNSHGLSNSRIYVIWTCMKVRCSNPKHVAFHRYGGRGIVVCESWLNFMNFRNDMYEPYLKHVDKFGEEDTTLDRIDNNAGYSLQNCRWVTRDTQISNRGSTNYLMKILDKINSKQFSSVEDVKEFIEKILP